MGKDVRACTKGRRGPYDHQRAVERRHPQSRVTADEGDAGNEDGGSQDACPVFGDLFLDPIPAFLNRRPWARGWLGDLTPSPYRSWLAHGARGGVESD